MPKPFNTTIADGIAEMILDHPPVNAFDSAGWFAIAAEIDALGANDEVRVIIIGAARQRFLRRCRYQGAGGGPAENRRGEQGQLRDVPRDSPQPEAGDSGPAQLRAGGRYRYGGRGGHYPVFRLRALRCAGNRPRRHGGRRSPAAYVPGAEGSLHVLHRRIYRCPGGLPPGRGGAGGAAGAAAAHRPGDCRARSRRNHRPW